MADQQYGLNMIVWGNSKHGKALALDTPLVTPSGWTTIGEVQPGDYLFNADGIPTQVVAVGPVWDSRPCRKVTVKGDVIIADAAHVWRATRPHGDNVGSWTLAETDQLKTHGGAYRHLPWSPELKTPDINLLLHPYILGVWLGDGGVRECRISGVDDRKLVVLERCLKLYGDGEITQLPDSRYDLVLPGIREILDGIGARVLIDRELRRFQKFVPSAYLRSGTEQRRELLAGLIDTDGCFQSYRALFSFTNTNLEIAQAAAELACSLGIRALVSGPHESYAHHADGSRIRGADHYDVPLRGIVAHHRITHRPEWQKDIPEIRHRTYERIRITSISSVPSVPVRCIQVDDLHGMFLAGRSMIPTHNSWLGDSAPGPRVVLDAESGSRFTPSRKIVWNPREAPPEPSKDWETAIVTVRDFSDVTQVYSWLNSGKHPFRSVIMDSISEVQQRAVDSIAGTNLMRTQDWGQLLRMVSDVVRKYRDLVTNPVKPMDCVIFIAMARQNQDGIWKPYVQGQLATTLPYYCDCSAYLGLVTQEDGTQVRRLFVGPVSGFETGERVGGRLGTYIDNPNITEMLEMVRNGSSPAEDPWLAS